MSGKHQFMLWWSGLRGAMAFALAVEAMKTFGEAGKVMMKSTFMVILITVLVNGGSTGYLLARCNLLQQKADSGGSAGCESLQNGAVETTEHQSVQDCEQVQLLVQETLCAAHSAHNSQRRLHLGEQDGSAGLKQQSGQGCENSQSCRPVMVITALAEGRFSEDGAVNPHMCGAQEPPAELAYQLGGTAVLIGDRDYNRSTDATGAAGAPEDEAATRAVGQGEMV